MIMQRLTGPALAVVFLLGGLGNSATAADFSDPTWPCIQRKVGALSVGLMWPHPVPEEELDPDTAKSVDELAQRLALRRLALEDLTPDIDAFTADVSTDKDLLGRVFSETFDRLSGTRNAIMQGIEEYSLSQIALSEKIDSAREEMDTIMAGDDPDFDKVDALEERIDWEERIYTERARSLTYICETPVLLEKRLYSIAQMLLAKASD
jgi:hypothetical protein